jgi:hypothetical protein
VGLQPRLDLVSDGCEEHLMRSVRGQRGGEGPSSVGFQGFVVNFKWIEIQSSLMDIRA